MQNLYFEFTCFATDCFVAFPINDSSNMEYINHTAQIIVDETLRIQEKYSRFLQDNYMFSLNQVAAKGGEVELDLETTHLMNLAYAYHNQSDGLFDVTSGILRNVWNKSTRTFPPKDKLEECLSHVGLEKIKREGNFLIFPEKGRMELDFGGIGKEYAVSRAIDICKIRRHEDVMVNFGGDIAILGNEQPNSPWILNLTYPTYNGNIHQEYRLEKGASTTSGSYKRYIEIEGEKYCHILNPKTGTPVKSMLIVSVICPQIIEASFYSTTAMLKDTEGFEWLDSQGVQFFAINNDGIENDRGFPFIFDDLETAPASFLHGA